MTRRNVTPYASQAPSLVQADPEPAATQPTPNQLMSAMRCLGIPPSQLRTQAPDELSTSAPKRHYTIITSDLLIPGDGAPVPHGALVVEARLIVWVGTRDAVPTTYLQAPHRSHHVPYMMPGLWDLHAHFAGPSADPEDAPRLITYGPCGEHPASQGARLARQCWAALQNGYTSMRDCGGLGCELAAAINDGSIVGPNVYGAGSYISQTAGHGDSFRMPPGDALLTLGVGNIRPGFFCDQSAMLADGVDECRQAIRLQVRRGAECIKIIVTGGITSPDDNPLDEQFSPEELKTLVDEATRMGRSVAAHAHAKAGILAAIHAGVATIEHGSFADEECFALMKEKNVMLVPTRRAITLLQEAGDAMPKKVRDKLALIAEQQLRAYKLAIAMGVTIGMGTDGPPVLIDGIEIQHAVETGMTDLEALKAATATAPRALGRRAPKSGQLKVGYEADILGVRENPAEDVRVLRGAEKIGWVWKGGRLFKGPGIGPWGEEV